MRDRHPLTFKTCVEKKLTLEEYIGRVGNLHVRDNIAPLAVLAHFLPEPTHILMPEECN